MRQAFTHSNVPVSRPSQKRGRFSCKGCPTLLRKTVTDHGATMTLRDFPAFKTLFGYELTSINPLFTDCSVKQIQISTQPSYRSIACFAATVFGYIFYKLKMAVSSYPRIFTFISLTCNLHVKASFYIFYIFGKYNHCLNAGKCTGRIYSI